MIGNSRDSKRCRLYGKEDMRFIRSLYILWFVIHWYCDKKSILFHSFSMICAELIWFFLYVRYARVWHSYRDSLFYMVDFIYLSPSFVIFALVGVLRSWRYAICAISAIAPSTTECQTENLVSAIELRRTFDHRPFGQHSRIAVDPWATRPHPLDNNAGNSTSIPSSFDSRDRYDEDDYAFPRTGNVLLLLVQSN